MLVNYLHENTYVTIFYEQKILEKSFKIFHLWCFFFLIENFYSLFSTQNKIFLLELKEMDLMWKLKIKSQILSILSSLNISVINHGLRVLQFYYSRRPPQFIPNLQHIQLILHTKQQTLFNLDLELSMVIKMLVSHTL